MAASPFCVVATSAPDGSCDASPKGDPAGFVHVIDDRTIAIPERKGNRRADGYREVFGHCAKAFMRSQLWHPQTWQPGAVPSRANIAHLTERPLDSVVELEKYYGETYSSGLS